MQERLFSRDEVLSGFPSRQAGLLLFLIESRTAQWTAQAKLDMQPFLLPQTAQEQDMEFLEAFTLGKEPPVKPTIQDLEHYAERWSSLAPENPGLRAAVAHRLGQKYRLSKAHISGIRSALALDDPLVQRAFERQFHQPLDRLYVSRLSPAEMFGWTWLRLQMWLESLPAFWTSFSVTLTETVGASILALPIALAGIGPLPGIILLVLLGLLNVITVEYMTETMARTGSVRFERAYFGRILSEYLGRAGSLIFSGVLVLLQFLVLIAYSVGISSTLQGATRIPAGIWVMLLMLAALYTLAGRSMQATVSSALAIGAINILLILILSLLALPHFKMDYLLSSSLAAGARWMNPSVLNLVFGTILAAYFGHTATANVARPALRRDPSGRGLIWGAMGAQVTTIFLYCLWTLAVNGSISGAQLAAQPGTVLFPLAQEAGPLVLILGSIFVLLGMGMGIVHFSRGCFNLVHERLPKAHRPLICLPRRGGRLTFHPPGNPDGLPRLGLVYLGFEQGQARFRLDYQESGRILRKEFRSGRDWEASLPGGSEKEKIQINIHILHATSDSVHVQVGSNYNPVYDGEWVPVGLNLVDLFTLPADQRQVLQWMMRNGAAKPEEIAKGTGFELNQTMETLKILQEQEWILEEESETGSRFRALMANRRRRHLPDELWKALEKNSQDDISPFPVKEKSRSWFLQKMQSERAKFWISAGPVILVFLFIEWMVLSQRESFAATLSFTGVIAVSLLGGIFPALLLASSRQKGDIVPEGGWGILGNPVLLGMVYLISLATLLLHGIVIWQDLFQRASALGVAAIIVLATIVMGRRGAFQPRLVVHLYQDARQTQGRLIIAGRGKPYPVAVKLNRCSNTRAGDEAVLNQDGVISSFKSLCSFSFHLGENQFHEMKVWAHRMAPDGDGEAIPAVVNVKQAGNTKQYDLGLTGGKTFIQLENGDCEVDMVLSENDRGGQNQA